MSALSRKALFILFVFVLLKKRRVRIIAQENGKMLLNFNPLFLWKYEDKQDKKAIIAFWTALTDAHCIGHANSKAIVYLKRIGENRCQLNGFPFPRNIYRYGARELLITWFLTLLQRQYFSIPEQCTWFVLHTLSLSLLMFSATVFILRGYIAHIIITIPVRIWNFLNNFVSQLNT